jgi:hypothetical protein
MAARAARLGVNLDVLEEATRESADEFRRQGKLRRQLGSKAFYPEDYANLEVTMPPKIHEEWSTFCRVTGLKSSVLLRSLVHDFLPSGSGPRTIGRSWLYGGERFKIKPSGRLHAKTQITRGAEIALEHRAKLLNVTTTGIVRGIIVDLLEGRGPTRLRVVRFSELWGEAAWYLQNTASGSQQPTEPPGSAVDGCRSKGRK